MRLGRPTEYTDDIFEQAREYLVRCNDDELEDEKLRVNLPTIEGLAACLRVNRDTLYEWAKIYPEFSDMLEEIRTNQAEKLINNGLAGRYNPTITKLLLTKHGYSDRQETDVTTAGKPLPIYGGLSVQGHHSDEEDIQPEKENSSG